MAEPDTMFVVKKMAKRLKVPIAKAVVSEGVLALENEDEDKQVAEQAA